MVILFYQIGKLKLKMIKEFPNVSKLVDEEVWSQARFIFNSNKKYIWPHKQTKIKK